MDAETLLQLKAAAFDRLMEIMEGYHECVDTYFVPEPSSLSTLIADEDYEKDYGTIRIRKVSVFEWRVRLRGSTDLRQSLLDEAAAKHTLLPHRATITEGYERGMRKPLAVGKNPPPTHAKPAPPPPPPRRNNGTI
jgi:hypothetical protein